MLHCWFLRVLLLEPLTGSDMTNTREQDRVSQLRAEAYKEVERLQREREKVNRELASAQERFVMLSQQIRGA